MTTLPESAREELRKAAQTSTDKWQKVWGDAWRRTVRTLLARGEWPMDVPVPDIRMMN